MNPIRTDIFIGGRDGCHTFRIPVLAKTASEAILAFCEGRRNSPDDAGQIALLLRRSSDEGKTWPRRLVLQEGPAAYSDLVVTGEGDILCLFECGETRYHERIALARFSLEDLRQEQKKK